MQFQQSHFTEEFSLLLSFKVKLQYLEGEWGIHELDDK